MCADPRPRYERGLLGSTYRRNCSRRARLHLGNRRGVLSPNQYSLGNCCGHRGGSGAGAVPFFFNLNFCGWVFDVYHSGCDTRGHHPGHCYWESGLRDWRICHPSGILGSHPGYPRYRRTEDRLPFVAAPTILVTGSGFQDCKLRREQCQVLRPHIAAQSGKGRLLTGPPHNTPHAGPHGAFPPDLKGHP